MTATYDGAIQVLVDGTTLDRYTCKLAVGAALGLLRENYGDEIRQEVAAGLAAEAAGRRDLVDTVDAAARAMHVGAVRRAPAATHEEQTRLLNWAGLPEAYREAMRDIARDALAVLLPALTIERSASVPDAPTLFDEDVS